MINSDWVLERAVTGLVIRMSMRPYRPYSRKNDECINAQIFCYHYDDDGPVFGLLSYAVVEGRPSMTLEYSASKDEWGVIVEDAFVSWPNPWKIQKDNFFQRGVHQEDRPIRWGTVAATNILVLQNLARIEGALGQLQLPVNGPDGRALIHTTMRRLRSLIDRGNEEWGNLMDGV